MCRSIKVLRRPESRATEDEISAAARQFVRKVSGFHKPSKVNEPAFEEAIGEIASVTRRLLASLPAAKPRPAVSKEPALEGQDQRA